MYYANSFTVSYLERPNTNSFSYGICSVLPYRIWYGLLVREKLQDAQKLMHLDAGTLLFESQSLTFHISGSYFTQRYND